MSRFSIHVVVVFAATLSLCLASNGVTACPVCVTFGDPFKLPHPHALRIAVATREARDKGILPAATTKPKGANTLQADMIRFAEHYFRSDRLKTRGPIIVDVLLVDEPALYRIEAARGRLQVYSLGAVKHREANACLVTTSFAVTSLGRLELTAAEAVHHGLLEIEGELAVVPGLKAVGLNSDRAAGKHRPVRPQTKSRSHANQRRSHEK